MNNYDEKVSISLKSSLYKNTLKKIIKSHNNEQLSSFKKLLEGKKVGVTGE